MQKAIHPLFALFAFLPSALWAEDSLYISSIGTPPGFEDLSTTQQSLVDIYYGNRYLTAQIATFDSEQITLSNPAALVKLIRDLNDPTLIESALSGELSTHSARVCPGQSDSNCGLLTPKVAGVIFDESRFRVDLFINRAFLKTRNAGVNRYLPPSDAGWSFMQNFNGVMAGTSTDGRENDYTLSGQSQLAWKENSLHMNWDYSRTQTFGINDLYASRNFEGVEYTGGMVGSGSFGLSFTSDRTLLGVRIGTSDSTRIDNDFTGGTPMAVFLPTRGRVEVLKEGRLIESWFLEAGNQQLDTSSFPSGAYTIELVILNETGQVISKETRFFAKQYRLPAEGEWEYFVETGRIMDRNTTNTLPTLTEQWVSRAGVSRRLADTLAGTAAVAIDMNDSLMELGLFHLGSIYELSPSVMMASNGDYGLGFYGRVTLGPLSTSGNYRRLWRKESDALTVENPDRPALLGDAFQQTSLSMSLPVWDGSLSYQFNDNRQFDGEATRSHGLDYRVNLWQASDVDIDLSVSLSRSGDTDIALFTVDFSQRSDHWTFRASPKAEVRDTDGQRDRNENLSLSASWDDRDLFASDVRADFGAETGTGDDRYDASLEVANSWGRGNLNLNRVQGDTGGTNFYSASFSTSFITDGDNIAVGGERQADSALVVQVKGREGDVFDVRINGQRRGYAIAGRPSVIPLSSYEQYRVSLSPAGTALYEFDERERSVTLYPGNVVTLDYDATPLQLWFGRLMLKGEPLAGARIRGGQYPAATDDLGMFQVEAPANLDALTVELADNNTCRLELPEGSDHFVQRIGTIELDTMGCSVD